MIRQKVYKKLLFKTAKLLTKNNNKVIKIIFPFSFDTVQEVKKIPGRRFINEDNQKHWECLLSIENIEYLADKGFKIDSDLKIWYHSNKIELREIEPIKIDNLPDTLYDFQKQGVQFLESLNGNALLADEMGLGKTIQALVYKNIHPELTPVIIVCPASLKYNWAAECKRWLDNPMVEVLSGTTPSDIIAPIVVINYDILTYWIVKLIKLKAKLIILDEAHYFKTNKTIRTKAVKRLTKEIPHKLCLTGTPIENRPVEIYNAINIINPYLFPNRWDFLNRYCGAKYNGFGWDFNGASNTAELHEKLVNSIMIRRLKKDVLDELPDKTISFVPLEMKNRREYEMAERNFIDFIRMTKGNAAARRASNAESLTEIETLKQVAVKNKLPQVISWIKDFLESGKKLVVFTIHQFVIHDLMAEFGNIAVKIDGSTAITHRKTNVDLFQNDPTVRLFIGNIDAAGVGITLTAASDVAVLEFPWTPGKLDQAIDRVHRITQKNAVNAYMLMALNTIEEDIARMLDDKRKVVQAVLNGKEVEQESLLTEIINKYLKS